MPHFSVRQRSPLRNNFMPSRRHCLHLGPVVRAIVSYRPEFLDAPPLARPATVVRLRRDVLDGHDLEACRLQRANRGLAARTRALHEDLDLLQAMFHSLTGTEVGGHLGGERRRLARALEARSARALPRDDVALAIGERDVRVVERRLDMRLSDSDVLAHLAARAAAGAALPARGSH